MLASEQENPTRSKPMTADCYLPESVAERLRAANGRRRERTMSRRELADLIRNAVLESKGADFHKWAHAGTVPGAYRYPSRTTVALVVVREGVVYVGVTWCPAHAATPGRAWAGLSPWHEGRESTRRKLDALIASGAMERLTHSEVYLILSEDWALAV
jgi:hypothetical protein